MVLLELKMRCSMWTISVLPTQLPWTSKGLPCAIAWLTFCLRRTMSWQHLSSSTSFLTMAVMPRPFVSKTSSPILLTFLLIKSLASILFEVPSVFLFPLYFRSFFYVFTSVLFLLFTNYANMGTSWLISTTFHFFSSILSLELQFFLLCSMAIP